MTPSRKTHLSLLSGTGLLLLAGVLTFANLISTRLFLRLDGTGDHRYSLSKASRTLVRSLEDPVHFRLYLTPQLPQPYESQGRYVRELLQEYRTAGRGTVEVEVIAPTPNMAMELNRLNLTPGRFTQVGSDQYQVREGYIGLVLRYQDKQDTIPFIKDVDNLEYEISSRVRLMTQKSKKTLLFASNHNEVSTQFLRQGPAQRMFEEFEVRSEALNSPTAGPTPDAVFLLGPQSQMSEDDLVALDHYVSSGIPVVVALNRRVIRPQSFQTMAQVTGLEPWLEHYGVRVDRDFILDEQCQRIAMQSTETTFYVNYWPFLVSTDLDRTHPVTRDWDSLGFPYAHPVNFAFSSPSAMKGTVLARSSARSWIWPGLYNVDPPSLFKQLESDPPGSFAKDGKSGQMGPFPLAVTVEGSTTTFKTQQAAPHAKLVVIGTSFFANPQVPNPPTNAMALMTLAHWLTEESGYLAIPPKGSPFRPLKPLSNGARRAVKAAGYFLIPLLIVLGAFFHWKHRRALRERVRAQFAPREGSHAEVA